MQCPTLFLQLFYLILDAKLQGEGCTCMTPSIVLTQLILDAIFQGLCMAGGPRFQGVCGGGGGIQSLAL